jgi:hypothetical protein
MYSHRLSGRQLTCSLRRPRPFSPNRSARPGIAPALAATPPVGPQGRRAWSHELLRWHHNLLRFEREGEDRPDGEAEAADEGVAGATVGYELRRPSRDPPQQPRAPPGAAAPLVATSSSVCRGKGAWDPFWWRSGVSLRVVAEVGLPFGTSPSCTKTDINPSWDIK